jgi:PAS domain-containing protein
MMADQDRRLRELQESEERLQAFMRHSPVLAFMKDAEGRYVYINSMMEQVFDITLATLEGKADSDWLPAAVAQTVRENDTTVRPRAGRLKPWKRYRLQTANIGIGWLSSFPSPRATVRTSLVVWPSMSRT